MAKAVFKGHIVAQGRSGKLQRVAVWRLEIEMKAFNPASIFGPGKKIKVAIDSGGKIVAVPVPKKPKTVFSARPGAVKKYSPRRKIK